MKHTSFTAERFIVVRCRSCGKPYNGGDPEMEVMIYDTMEEAIAALREDEEWAVVPHELDAYCPDHLPLQAHPIPSHIRDQY